MAFDLTGATKLPMLGQPPKTDWGTTVNTNSAELWELNDGWTVETPTYLNMTAGNGTVTSRLHRVADLVIWSYSLTFGTTTAITGWGQVGSTLRPFYGAVGDAAFFDSSATRWYPGTAQVGANGEFFIFAPAGPGTIFGTDYPFTWDTGDILTFTAIASNAYGGKVAP